MNKKTMGKYFFTSLFNRRLLTPEEWKNMFIFKSYILPFLFISIWIVVLLGNHDSFFVLTALTITVILLIVYTKRKIPKDIDKLKIPKYLLITTEILSILISLFIMYDVARYGMIVSQVQFQNKGYTTLQYVGKESLANNAWKVIEMDKSQKKVYQHIFEGNKYLSKVEVENYEGGENYWN